MEKSTQIFTVIKYQKNGFHFICLSVTLIDSVSKTGKNYYSQVLLEECKYVVREKKIPKYIIDNIENSFDSDREMSDEENSDKETSDEEKFDEKSSDKENFDK